MSFFEKFKNYNIPLYGVRLPEIKIEKEDKDALHVDENCSNIDFLKALANQGFKNRIKLGHIDIKKKNEYIERARYEMETFIELGFVDYILIIWDIINFAKKKNIPVGPGRGSSGGSLI